MVSPIIVSILCSVFHCRTICANGLDKCCPSQLDSIFFFWLTTRLAVNQPEFQQRGEFRCPLFVTRSAARQLIRFCRERDEALGQSNLQSLRGLFRFWQRQRAVNVLSRQRENHLRVCATGQCEHWRDRFAAFGLPEENCVRIQHI